jgi:hypothetical protein
MILLAAASMSALCIGFSLRQLVRVIRAADSDPKTLVALCEENPDAVVFALRSLGPFERALADELELRLKRGARVPAIAARIASSVGFLCSTLFLRRALLDASETGDFGGIVLSGVGIVAAGLAGAWSCAAVHRTAQRELATKVSGLSALCEHLIDVHCTSG